MLTISNQPQNTNTHHKRELKVEQTRTQGWLRTKEYVIPCVVGFSNRIKFYEFHNCLDIFHSFIILPILRLSTIYKQIWVVRKRRWRTVYNYFQECFKLYTKCILHKSNDIECYIYRMSLEKAVHTGNYISIKIVHHRVHFIINNHCHKNHWHNHAGESPFPKYFPLWETWTDLKQRNQQENKS